MKTINLRKLYFPHYSKNVFVEVSDEVAEVLHRSDREMDNYRRRTCYHRAFYSLDAFDWTERYALAHSPSPEELLVLREQEAARARLRSLLGEALSSATPTQARRIRCYYLQGVNIPAISRTEGIATSVASRSIRAGLDRMRAYYDRLPS